MSSTINTIASNLRIKLGAIVITLDNQLGTKRKLNRESVDVFKSGRQPPQ
jgi:hypothetical protein